MSGKPEKCMKCDKPIAYKITKIINGEIYDFLLCADHAQAVSPTLKKTKENQLNQSNLFGLIQQFLNQQQEGGGETEEAGAAGPVCVNCHLSYDQYKKTLLLGCSECYKSFEDLLVKDLRKFHGAVSQNGEPGHIADEAAAKPTSLGHIAPKSHAAAGVSLKDNLRKQLADAIQKEDFSKAATLRDQIRKLEQAGKSEEAKK